MGIGEGRNNKPRRGLPICSALRRRGLRWTVGIGPWPIRKNWNERAAPAISNIARRALPKNARISRSRAAGHAQASATSPGLILIIALDHLLSGVTPHTKRKYFSSQVKSELSRDKFAQLIAMRNTTRSYILGLVICHLSFVICSDWR